MDRLQKVSVVTMLCSLYVIAVQVLPVALGLVGLFGTVLSIFYVVRADKKE